MVNRYDSDHSLATSEAGGEGVEVCLHFRAVLDDSACDDCYTVSEYMVNPRQVPRNTWKIQKKKKGMPLSVEKKKILRLDFSSMGSLHGRNDLKFII